LKNIEIFFFRPGLRPNPLEELTTLLQTTYSGLGSFRDDTMQWYSMNAMNALQLCLWQFLHKETL